MWAIFWDNFRSSPILMHWIATQRDEFEAAIIDGMADDMQEDERILRLHLFFPRY